MYIKHGMSGTRTWKSWDSMKQRCTNHNSPDYPKWGGRGITVCDRWLNSFENFYADMGERPEGKTLHRVEDSKEYGPTTCKWATPAEQQRDKSNSRWITYKGESKLLIDWAKEFGIPYDLLLRRANRGLTEEALFAPSRSKKVSRFKGI